MQVSHLRHTVNDRLLKLEKKKGTEMDLDLELCHFK